MTRGETEERAAAREVYAMGDGIPRVNGLDFSQDAAARRAGINPAGLSTYVDSGGTPVGYGIESSGNGIVGWQDRFSAQPSRVRAGDYGGSMERIARAQLGSGASQRDINNYVGQLIELNGISNPRRVGGDLDIALPGANTPAATSGLGVYGKDIAQGEQMKAAARAEQMAASAPAGRGVLGGRCWKRLPQPGRCIYLWCVSVRWTLDPHGCTSLCTGHEHGRIRQSRRYWRRQNPRWDCGVDGLQLRCHWQSAGTCRLGDMHGGCRRCWCKALLRRCVWLSIELLQRLQQQ